MLRFATRFCFLAASIILGGSAVGCVNSNKKYTTPPAPLENFTPLPDPRDAKMKEAADKQKAIPIPADPVPSAARDNSWSLPPGVEPPKPLAPISPLPNPSGDAPKPLSNRDDAEAIPVARGSSAEIDRPEDRGADDLNALFERAAARLKTLDSIESRLTMHDVKEGKAMPVEVVRFRHRLQPYAVRMTWTGEAAHGRDVLYVAGKYDGKLQMLTAKGDIPFMQPQLMAFAPDDPILKARSKHDIRDAGPTYPLRHLQSLAKQNTFASRLMDKGIAERPDFKGPLRLIEETVAAGDRFLPRGGKRRYYFDAGENSPSMDLPVVIIATETGGRNVESMVFDQFRCNHLTDADFDAKKLGH